MIYNLPPLPEPFHGFYAAPMYSADQMRAYAQAALDALADEAEASIKAMIEEGLGQVQPVAWQAVGGSIWGHKTSEDDRPLYTAPQPAPAGEPVAWIYQNANTEREYLVWQKGTGGRNWRPLYTAPEAP
jgi:hypothetical protein